MDNENNTIDFLLAEKRDKKAANHFFNIYYMIYFHSIELIFRPRNR